MNHFDRDYKIIMERAERRRAHSYNFGSALVGAIALALFVVLAYLELIK